MALRTGKFQIISWAALAVFPVTPATRLISFRAYGRRVGQAGCAGEGAWGVDVSCVVDLGLWGASLMDSIILH